MHPLVMQPVLKDYIWGGTRLKEEYGKESDLAAVAESWEVSCHPDGGSQVAEGPLAGQALSAVLAEHPEWMGGRCAGMEEFPLLIKLIDARQCLSLQVHPEDDYARRVENQLGKNEMWYVVDAAPGAELVLGLNEPISREELAEHIADGSLLAVTRRVPVKAGDCFCIPAGLLHAIGDGTLIAEIQQNSNVTYRVFDYGRRNPDGQPRELHVDKALDVIDRSLRAENTVGGAVEALDGYRRQPLAGWRFFHTDLLEVESAAALVCTPESFQCLLVVAGSLCLRWGGQDNGEVALPAGRSVFLPAGMGAYTLTGSGRALLTWM